MDNEIQKRKSWIGRNWKWLTPVGVIGVLGLMLLFSAISQGNPGDFALALKDNQLYQGAVDKANQNEDVKNAIGTLDPVDKMAILESTVEYSDNKQSVNLTVRVSGSKGKAKMDVQAVKSETAWHYKFIKMRIKNPKQEIIVLE